MLAFEDMGHASGHGPRSARDPDWQSVRAESESDGPLVHHIENRLMTPTDFSPLG